MAGTSVQDLRAQIEAAKRAVTDPREFAKRHAEIAKRALKDLEAAQGVHPTTVIVDGRRGAREESVQPFGIITYEISFLADVVNAVWKALIAASPVGPGKDGHYKDDHLLFVNRQRVEATPGDPKLVIPPGAVCVIVNAKPYARKIEGGFKREPNPDAFGPRGGKRFIKKRRPGLSVQAPDGVYEVAVRALQRRFGNMASLSFTYEAVDELGIVTGKRSNKSDLRYPCVIITELAD